MEIEEGIQHISKMLTYGDTGLPTLQWLMLNLEQAQLEVGIGIPLLEFPYKQYGFLCMDSKNTVCGILSQHMTSCLKIGTLNYHCFNGKVTLHGAAGSVW